MKQSELSNADVVVYVIYKLGGVEKKIHTEHIAMECFKLAKERFCWRLPEYRNYPNKQYVREALKEAKYFKEGALVTGRAGVEAAGREVDGWTLTPEGVKWIIKNCKRIEKSLKISAQLSKRPDIQRIIQKFKREECYQKYLRDRSVKNINQYEFKDMLKCSPDAYPETIRKEFNRLRTQSELTQDRGILTFLNACENAFGDIMGIKKPKRGNYENESTRN